MKDIRIEYCTWGSVPHFTPNCRWQAIYNKEGDLYDIGSRDFLISECKKEGLSYEVIRHHRNRTKSVMERG